MNTADGNSPHDPAFEALLEKLLAFDGKIPLEVNHCFVRERLSGEIEVMHPTTQEVTSMTRREFNRWCAISRLAKMSGVTP